MTGSEEELVAAARGGSQDAIGRLFALHWDRAWRVAHAVTGSAAAADDVAQDAFLRAIGALKRFDGRRPFAVWLDRIVVNGAIDALRRDRRLRPLEDARHVAARNGTPADPGVMRALAALRPERRAVVVLHYWLGYPLSEVAELLGVAEGTAHSRMARALGDLRTALGVTDG